MTALLLIAAFALGCMLAVALIAAALLALYAAAVAVGAWVWVPIAAARYERVLKRRDAALVKLGMLPPPPSAYRRHAVPKQDPSAVETDEYWHAAREASEAAEEQQHAKAMAAVAADVERVERPEPSPTVGYTAVMPIVVTGVAAAFGAAVVEPQQLPWTAPASAAVDSVREARHAAAWAEGGDGDAAPVFAAAGRHVGTAAVDLSEWRVSEYGGTR